MNFQSEHPASQKAVIYCRVSGKKQVAEGSGLDSQEFRCRQYAEAKGYEVEAVFPDDVSGGGDFIKRPGMVALLKYLGKNPTTNYVVIFDDLKRYARDVEFHLKLRRVMSEYGAKRECLNFNFEDTPEGKFNEIISAAAGELERLQMGRQNRQKAMARLEQGYAIQAQPPVGYKYEQTRDRGKVLIRDEPVASIVQEGLKGYASGRFASQIEVARFFENQPDFPRCGSYDGVRQTRVVRLLQQEMYAGYVSMPSWGIMRREGQHEALITKDEFETIQARLHDTAYTPARADISSDFPLRGAVCCASCNSQLTGGWSKGKYKKYPYYLCQKRGCDLKGKSIPRDKLEAKFRDHLTEHMPSPQVLKVVAAMFQDCWDAHTQRAAAAVTSVKGEIARVESQISQLVDKLVDAHNPRVASAYEKRIDELERKQLSLREKASKPQGPHHSMEHIIELSFRFLANPRILWDSGRLDLRRLVLKLAVDGPMTYDRRTDILNSKKPLPFNMLEKKFGSDYKMVLLGSTQRLTRSVPWCISHR